MAIKTISPLDQYREKIVEWVQQGKSDQWISEALSKGYRVGTTRHSIRRARGRWNLKKIEGVENASFSLSNHKVDITGTVSFDASTPDDLLRERGLDPNDWEITRLIINEFEALTGIDSETGFNEVKTLKQLKISCTRKKSLLLPARSDGYKPPKRIRSFSKDYETIVVVGDYQAPFYDKRLHDIFCSWLEKYQPERGINLGDLHDFPDISRHDLDPENIAYANECIQSAYDICRDHILASPNTLWDLLPGNHDQDRLRAYLIKNAPALYNLKRASSNEKEGEIVNNIRHLLRLDELGINYHSPHGTYEDVQINLGHELAIRHGWIANKGAGASALKTLEKTGFSILVGHTHRQGLVRNTSYDINGNPVVLTAVEIGCMCRIENVREEGGCRRFPNYTIFPDWQQGWAVVNLWKDGKFNIDLASYMNGTLYFRNERFA